MIHISLCNKDNKMFDFVVKILKKEYQFERKVRVSNSNKVLNAVNTL